MCQLSGIARACMARGDPALRHVDRHELVKVLQSYLITI